MIAIGFLLGFIGYLPFGNINMTVVQISLSETAAKVWMFILFVAFMEFAYCVGCLEGLEVLMHQPGWVLVLKWMAVGLFTLLGLMSYFHTEGAEGIRGVSGIKKGIFIAIVNPLQIPFWLVWGVYLMENKYVQNTTLSIVLFALITSIGTISVLQLYAVGGKKLIEKLNLNRTFINRFIGIIFIILAVWQLFRLVHPGNIK